ncbi:TIGR04076 family protein [Clostridium cavendishii DSM 21758]|uniref:TIGR04076 family protein n=1 Tax=Clostridium cavendishii DSM 21758 TaxID=1121302 RepID=A0A1M6T4B8_9CLOT|nr:TIGR04076 family protein [Clostridium cavendishii]SHK51726.1 TIGR04076 family protein [Clostridium cavendishii DSM 21758]
MNNKKYYDVRITILKKLKVEDIYNEYAKSNMPIICAKGQVGDEFISKNCEMPEKFCKGAWEGLKSKVAILAAGENSPYTNQEGVAIHSCNDGLHPVIYKLQRIEE